MSQSAKLHGLAASARIANLPSVVSNVWLGCVLAVAGYHMSDDRQFLQHTAVLCVACVFLCLSGNFLNDWADRAWDATHRPERALPRGLFPPRIYLLLAALCGLLGLGAAVAVHPLCLVVALAIMLNIIVYTWLHKRTAWAVIPMGLCRALLPVMGVLGFAGPENFSTSPAMAWIVLAPIPAGLFCHVAGLSLNARHESLAESVRGATNFAPLWFAAAAASMFAWTILWRLTILWNCLYSPMPVAFCALGLLPYSLWITCCLTISRRPVSRQVANLLAGIPLVDWIVLLPVGLEALSAGVSPTYLSFFCLLVSPLAFLAGKLLQRLAPAT